MAVFVWVESFLLEVEVVFVSSVDGGCKKKGAEGTVWLEDYTSFGVSYLQTRQIWELYIQLLFIVVLG